MSENVYIIGAGIHPFGRTDSRSGREQGVYAVREALGDAGLEWPDIECAYGGSAAAGNADIMVNELGLTSLPFTNVANGCATGGSALAASQQAIASGMYDLALAVGFDKHPRGAFNAKPADYGLPEWYGQTGMMLTTQFFALKIQRYMQLHGISRTTLGRVAEKAFRNGTLTPHAWRRSPVDLDTIMNAPMINDPLTKYMFCSPAEGAVALILASEKKMKELGAHGVKIRSVAVKTRPPNSFEVFQAGISIEEGGKPTVLASQAAFEKAGLGPEDIDVAQLQDTESGAEIMHMAENGFCKDGEQEEWLANGWTEIRGGRLPVNTDGGCLACGEPIGASGLRQVYENVQQLRQRSGERQVAGKDGKGPRFGYSHVYGAPGLSAVAIFGARMTGRMEGKVALVSGGAEGIGAAVARLIVAEGGSVMLGDVQLEKAQGLAAELGERAEAVQLDVRDLHQWEAAVSATRERFGKLTVLCNIAGISEPGNVPDGSLDVWERTIDINLHGPFYGMRAAIPAMEASGEPCAIVNIGSMIAMRPASFVAAYSASKAGLRGLTQSVALDLAERGLPIRANMVHPGAIRTPMYNRYKFSGADTPENIETNFAATHPMNRIGEPEEVARAVVFLASDEASFTTGCDFTVDGGGSIRS